MQHIKQNVPGLIASATNALRCLSDVPKNASPQIANLLNSHLYQLQPEMVAQGLELLAINLQWLRDHRDDPLAAEAFFDVYYFE